MSTTVLIVSQTGLASTWLQITNVCPIKDYLQHGYTRIPSQAVSPSC